MIVDDDLFDKMWGFVEELVRKYFIKVIRRMKEKGFFLVVICGFKEVFGDVFVVMDVDF